MKLFIALSTLAILLFANLPMSFCKFSLHAKLNQEGNFNTNSSWIIQLANFTAESPRTLVLASFIVYI